MTKTDILTDYYGLMIQSLMQEAREAYQAKTGECEPVTAERVQMCAARKRDQLRRARAAGFLEERTCP